LCEKYSFLGGRGYVIARAIARSNPELSDKDYNNISKLSFLTKNFFKTSL